MANPTMQSRHLRKGHPVRSSGHAVDKWQDERKVHLGVIFESWKSLREKRADTDPGLAFHLMEIHDQYCFCRFEDAETSDVRDSDVDDSSDIPVHFKQSEDTEETTDRYSDPRSLDSGEYLPKQVRETSVIPNVQSPDQQQHYSPVTESFSRPLNTFQDSPSPTNNETETSEKTGSSQEDSYFSASHKTVQLFDYPSSKSASKESLQPVYVYQNVQEAGTARQSVLGEKMRCNASNSASRVKVEPIDIDSDTDELEHFQHRTENIQTSAVVADATENQNDSVEIKQITTDSSKIEPGNVTITISSLLTLESLKSENDQKLRENKVTGIQSKTTEQCQYVCHFCAKCYRHEASLRRHFLQHSPSNKHICLKCNKEFSEKRYLKQHVSCRHGDTPLQLCSDCGLNFKSLNALSNHRRFKHQNKVTVCSECGYTCKDKYALHRHMKKHDRRRSECPKCLQTFKNVESHVKKCHVEQTKKLSCGVCGVRFVEERYLMKHYRHKHLGGNHYEYCCTCGKVFSYSYSLNRHKRTCVQAVHS